MVNPPPGIRARIATARPALLACLLATALSVPAVEPARAQSCDPQDDGCGQQGQPGPSSSGGADSPREVPALERRDRGFLNSRGTASITAQIDRIEDTCDRMNQNYVLHCLVVELRQVADEIPPTGDYAPVRAALVEATRGLQAIVDANADPATPRVRTRIGGRPAAPLTDPITAIRPDAVARATAEAERLLDEAATVLLRSAGNSARRQAAFQPIAQALDSTKVLLRSA